MNKLEREAMSYEKSKEDKSRRKVITKDTGTVVPKHFNGLSRVAYVLYRGFMAIINHYLGILIVWFGTWLSGYVAANGRLTLSALLQIAAIVVGTLTAYIQSLPEEQE